MKKILSSLIFKLLVGITTGIVAGLFIPEGAIGFVISIKHVLGQLIFFMVPLIILGFIAPSITKLNTNTSTFLTLALALAYLSSIGGALFSMFSGYAIIPHLDIQSVTAESNSLPKPIFLLDIPPVMSVMTALVLSLTIGLAVNWTQSESFRKLLLDFHHIVLILVKRLLLPILPFFIAANFCILMYEGDLVNYLPVFLKIILIVIVGHFIWLAFLYISAGLYSGKNPWEVLKHYGSAYFTALGTMSSAATLAVALESVRKSKVLRKNVTEFSIPLFANIHLCGSVLTEVFFVMAVSQLLYGALPPLTSMIIFVLLLGIFAIGAPGVPGGTVLASLGLIVSVLGFDETGTALMITIFALQDSFGTACNITGDGALTLILSSYGDKKGLTEVPNEEEYQ
ncbi:MAG: dicarboxylate/amino acid:cation symporter [Flavobacteriaceae bacterium]|jgi:Na+/H+-dicarboxylate symporter|nr:dicarboxylate/amino acid:cation symporter [Flavobacteriaceae bacterium]